MRFFSFPVTYGLLFFYALSCGVATFVEHHFGISSAKALIYEAFWFDCLHCLLALNLIGVLYKGNLWKKKKYASLLLHFSFLIILLGAGLTRYFGIDGGMHIREGESSDELVTRKEFIQLIAFESGQKILLPVLLTPLKQNRIDEKIKLDGVEITLQKIDYRGEKNNAQSKLTLLVQSSDFSKTLTLSPNYSNKKPDSFEIGGKIFEISWEPQRIKLPFLIHLQNFIIDRYPGSNSPSSYASNIIVEDTQDKISFPYVIFSNQVLDYQGYRLYQSSYDTDERGSILSVNYDPGKLPTYLGYTLLCLGFLGIFFSPNGRFAYLKNKLKTQAHFLALLLCFFSPLWGESLEIIERIKNDSLDASNAFGRIMVQDYDGRVKPIDSMAMDFIHKMIKSDSFLGLNYNQIFLGMMVYPQEFKQLRMFPVRTVELRKLLGMQKGQKYLAFNDVLSAEGYVLANYVQDANRKNPSERNQMEKEILLLDEKINIAYYIYTANALRIFPDLKEQNLLWYSPAQKLPFSPNQTREVQKIFGDFFFGFYQGVQENRWDAYYDALQRLKDLQQKYGSFLIPKTWKTNLEIFLNHSSMFQSLAYLYLIVGIVLFCVSFISLLRNTEVRRWFYYGVYSLLFVGLLIHTMGLLMRWFIGNHAPWSNAYESMIYIAWACVFASVSCFRKSLFALCSSSVMAGIFLAVAHLGFMDPQITNLVPVLKSHWLTIHVSIITASYGFLALCFMLGLIELVLFAMRNPKRGHIDLKILNLHCINEMSMMIGLAMLTIGNFLGGVWANESWGRYWGWDPKETWALISIVVYTLVLHLRFVRVCFSPFSFAVASVLAFWVILMTYFGVNYYLSGLHSYASGDAFGIPIWVYLIFGAMIGMICLASLKRNLEFC